MIRLYDAMAVLRRRFDTDVLGRGPRNVFQEMFTLPRDVVPIWVFEGVGSIRARRELFPGYKDRPSNLTDGLRSLIELTREALDHTRALQIAVPGREADDTLAHLCQVYGRDHDVVLHTVDRDLLALQGGRVKVDVKPLKIVMDPLDHSKDVTVEPKNIQLYKVLVGDPSDRIPGMSGFGPKMFAVCNTDFLQRAMQSLLDGYPKPALFVHAGVKEAMANRICLPEQAEQLRAFWKVVGFLPMPEDWAKHIKAGVESHAAGDAILRRFMH